MSRRRQPDRPRRKGWTIQRATGTGVTLGFAALVMRLFLGSAWELLRLPLLVLCLATAFCGLSILWITAVDRLRHGRRGERLIPVRTFDIAIALLMVLPSLWLVPALV